MIIPAVGQVLVNKCRMPIPAVGRASTVCNNCSMPIPAVGQVLENNYRIPIPAVISAFKVHTLIAGALLQCISLTESLLTEIKIARKIKIRMKCLAMTSLRAEIIVFESVI